MKSRRLGLALVLALLVSLVATYFLYSRMKRQINRSGLVRIVASAKPLEAGTLLTADQLMLVDWPTSLPLDGTVTKPEQLVGRILLYPIPQREPIRESLLAGPGAAIGLTAKIPEGMRAVAVVTNEVNNVSGFLFPGSHVDVLVTFRPDVIRGAEQDAMTTTVLQNVEVLSTGERLEPDPTGKPQNVKVVTLLLAPDDAQKLLLAHNQGTVQFVLRNGADQVQAEHQPVLMRELQGGAKAPPPPAAKVAKKAVPVSKPAMYQVEVIDGTKKSVVQF